MSIVRKVMLSTLTLSSVAVASETRVDTLRNIGGIQDETDVFTYSGRAARNNFALVELGTSSDTKTWGAALKQTSSKLSFGAAINRHHWQSSDNNSASSVFLENRFLYAATANSAATKTDALFAKGDRSLDLLAGYALNSDNSIGLRLSTAKERTKQTITAPPSSTQQSTDAMELGLGFSRIAYSSIDVNMAVMITDHYKYEQTTGSSTSGADLKSSSMRLDARWLAESSGSGLFADGSLATRSASATITAANTGKTGKFSEQVIRIGGGYAYTPKDQPAKLYAGLNLYKTSSKGPNASGSASTFASSISNSTEVTKIDGQWIDTSISGEGKFYENIGAMVGSNYVIFGSLTEKDNVNKTKTEIEISSPSDTNLWSLGLFWATERARVDASFSKQLLHNGPHFIAGNTTNPMLTRLSATYSF